MEKQRQLINLCALGVSLFALITAAWFPLHHDVYFHTDIARDFLLIEEVLSTKKLTLIGPRAGGIPGVFHGPLWLYLNLPIFALTQGNPIALGWYWVGLFGLSGWLFYIISRKLFDTTLALLSTSLYLTILAPTIPNSFNPVGAVLVSALWFYWFYQFIKTKKWLYLVGSYFVLGIIGQFQIAFAGPIFVLQTVYLIPFLWRTKQLHYLLTALAFCLPLLSHGLFEYRHQFLQTKALLEFFRGSEVEEKYNFIKTLLNRTSSMFWLGHGLLSKPFVYALPFAILIILLVKQWRKRIAKNLLLKLFLYFYVGFWIIYLLFKGVVWSYYYWAFMPLSILAWHSCSKSINRNLIISITGFIMIVNLWGNLKWLNQIEKFMGRNPGSWNFHQTLAQNIFTSESGKFGFFVYTPDQYGYSPWYAMLYQAKITRNNQVFPYEKMSTTYLIVAPDSPDNPYTSAEYWKQNKVKITSDPVATVVYANGYRVEKYNLTPEEINVKIDPNIIRDLHFR